MSEEKKGKGDSDRRKAVESLAREIFTRIAAEASTRGRTPTALAEESLRLAREFYRTCDETN